MLCYKTKLGEAYCGKSEILIDMLEDESVDLFITSPPYPLINPKEYGNKSQEIYDDWIYGFIKRMLPKLKSSGSIVLDFGVSYFKGEPAYNIYAFRLLVRLVDELGLKLCQPYFWYNPSRLPMQAVYTSKRKIRAKDNVNNIWWLSKTAFPKADTTKVLRPYSKAMKKLFRSRKLKGTSWKKNDGALPTNLLEISNSDNKNKYLQACRMLNMKPHPARFPKRLPEFFIKMLTDEGDLVIDIFAGSNTVGEVSESLNRRWKSFEFNRDYVASSAFRFISDIDNARACYEMIVHGRGSVDITEY
ncbi:MAG: site-specific DNA-methyltransferase [Ruminococcus sp.]|nr:site-specific DNA-methyltransferase [Ruminococcus sp.]